MLDVDAVNEIHGALREAKAVQRLFAGRVSMQTQGGGGGAFTAVNPVDVTEALLNPAQFTAMTIKSMLANPSATLDSDVLASGVKILAAKAKAGDMDYVRESLVGHSLMLQALAAVALEKAADCRMAKDKALLYGVAIKAQTVSAKLLCSLAGIPTHA